MKNSTHPPPLMRRGRQCGRAALFVCVGLLSSWNAQAQAAETAEPMAAGTASASAAAASPSAAVSPATPATVTPTAATPTAATPSSQQSVRGPRVIAVTANEKPEVGWGTKPPKSGLAQLIAGGVLTGLGILNLAGLGLCYADSYPEEARSTCKTASLVVVGAALGIGIPLLIVGGSRRSDFKAWKAQHPRVAASTLRVFHSAGATQVVFSAAF